MKLTVIEPITVNQTDRKVTLTTQILSDANVLIKTKQVMIPADTYTSTVIYERLNDVLVQEIAIAHAFPVTDQQAKDLALGITIRIPG